jgi:hypothetical protein
MTPAAGSREVEVARTADPRSNLITGKEDIVIVISPGTTAKQLEEFREQMKVKGVELKFDKAEFEGGRLIELIGTMRYKNSKSSFSGSDFKKMILAMVEIDGEVYFKVNLEAKEVI